MSKILNIFEIERLIQAGALDRKSIEAQNLYKKAFESNEISCHNLLTKLQNPFIGFNKQIFLKNFVLNNREFYEKCLNDNKK